MVSNGFPNVIISGRNPPLYCTFITLITYIHGHQNTNKEHGESRYPGIQFILTLLIY